MNQEDEELLQVFLEEVHEHLDGIEGDLLSIEAVAPEVDINLVNKVFRAVHSVKGGAGFFGLESILGLSHAMENLLGMMQKRELAPSSGTVGLLLEAADVLANMVQDAVTSNDRDISELVARLNAVRAGGGGPSPRSQTPKALSQAPSALGAPPPEPQQQQPSSSRRQQPAEVPSPPPPSPSEPPKRGELNAAASKGESSIRVQLPVLDRLMTLAGELVLTRNQLLQSHQTDPGKNAEATQRIDHITTELQDAIMATRMQSIGVVFHRFRRVVRDLAAKLGKEVDLVLEGEEVELDRTIIEAIGDPLTHLVRNALDHGLEVPSRRAERGKPKRGRLRLSAMHKGGQVVIEIQDDGAGIDPQRIRAKAQEKGLYSAEQLSLMSESALIRLIFKPGFSTATQVTEVSGRGVGMDVVHSNLARIGGVVDVQSVVGVGTTMRVKLPLTLAIIPCLLVTEEGESFAIPQANLAELHCLPIHEVSERIKMLGGAMVLRLRGDLIPLVRLREVLGIVDRQSSSIERLSSSRPTNIAVVSAGDFRYGIIVEALQDSSEIVVKPLGRHLRSCDAYAGATILGDGKVALILDVVSIARRLRNEESSEAALSRLVAQSHTVTEHDKMTILLARNGGEALFAIPLGLVARIERISSSDVQHVGGKRTLVYRNRLLPLIAVEDVANMGSDPSRGQLLDAQRQFVVVFKSHSREVGLLVADLLDIVDATEELDELTHHQPGIFGSLLIDGRVTLLLDVQGIVRQVLGEPASEKPLLSARPEEVFRVLVVDDSRFFQERLRAFVLESGHQVLVAGDGEEALAMLRKAPEAVNLILTDIEMPKMDGVELTRRVRADVRLKDIPVIAITSLMGEEAELRGKNAGVDEYLIKLDRDRLLERVNHYLKLGRAGLAGDAWSAA